MPDVTGFKAIVPKKRMVIVGGWSHPEEDGDGSFVAIGVAEVLSILVNLRDATVDYLVRDAFGGLNPKAKGDYYRFKTSDFYADPSVFTFYRHDAWPVSCDGDEVVGFWWGRVFDIRIRVGNELGIPRWDKVIAEQICRNPSSFSDDEKRFRKARLRALRYQKDVAQKAGNALHLAVAQAN